MKQVVFLVCVVCLVAGCSFFDKGKNAYRESDSVADLAIPPELDRPQRRGQFDVPEQSPQTSEADGSDVESAETTDVEGDAEK